MAAAFALLCSSSALAQSAPAFSYQTPLLATPFSAPAVPDAPTPVRDAPAPAPDAGTQAARPVSEAGPRPGSRTTRPPANASSETPTQAAEAANNEDDTHMGRARPSAKVEPIRLASLFLPAVTLAPRAPSAKPAPEARRRAASQRVRVASLGPTAVALAPESAQPVYTAAAAPQPAPTRPPASQPVMAAPIPAPAPRDTAPMPALPQSPSPAYEGATAATASLGGPGLTLHQVVENTLLTNPEIQARYHDFRSALEGQSVSRGGFLPQVNTQAYYGREYRSNVPDQGGGKGSESWSRPGYNVELRQLIFDGFRTPNDIKQAGFDKLARFYDLLAVSDTTAMDAVQAFIDLQRYRDMESLARQNYALHESTLKQIDERTESGVGRRVDQEQAGGRLALAQTNLMTETANLLDVTQRFQRITGMSPPANLLPVPDIASRLPTRPTDFATSLRRNPSFLSKQASLQAAEAGVASSRGAFSPKFEFVASHGQDQTDPSPDYKDIRSSSVQIMMTYNLYRGGADSARVRQTTAQQYAARDVRDYTCRNVQQDLAVAWNNVTRVQAQLPFLRDHELATAKVRDAYRQQFQIGQRTLLDLLNTENELFESRRSLVNAEYDLRIAQYRWLALSHSLLPALSLRPARDEMPEENGRLEVSDEVIRMCSSAMPESARLRPVKVKYNDGPLPPTLVPMESQSPQTGLDPSLRRPQ
nr:TolC family outer membrane protein [Bordetella ansorpii]